MKKEDGYHAEFDRHARIYSEKIDKSMGVFGQGHDFFVRIKASVLLELLGEIGRARDMKLLDVGCGIGLVHPYLVDGVAELHGVDVSRDSLAIARERNAAVAYASYDGTSLPYSDGAFDCAYAICVLHHVPVAQWQHFVTEMMRVVKPGGIAVVIEHNPLNPATQWVVRTCELDQGAILLWPRRLKRLFADAGLRAIKTQYIEFTPFDSPFFRRMDALLSRIPLGAQYVVRGRVVANV